jgi:hypothetical protein
MAIYNFHRDYHFAEKLSLLIVDSIHNEEKQKKLDMIGPI